MWRSNRSPAEAARSDAPADGVLKSAFHQARIESADRTGVVVDLRDAEVARLELLNEALDPLFAEIPPGVELFDRGISRGDPPRLWLDVVVHVVMGRDKRQYRLVQDTRSGRKVLAESAEIPAIVEAVTRYVAGRLVEREQALAETPAPRDQAAMPRPWRRRRGAMLRAFLFGLVIGCAALFAALWLVATRG